MGYEWALREKSLNIDGKMVRIANLMGSEQQKDLSEPPNCEGYGRIRHFKIHRYDDWSADPLPNLPAATALGRSPDDTLKAQVFQIAACNWNCWYCFVDADRKNADRANSKFFSAEQLIELMLQEESSPDVIDLSGGQPDIAPEWTLWMMEALIQRGLERDVFLWNDDNLSIDFFKRFLSENQISRMTEYPKYARVGCFKGFDPSSFSFNTSAPPERYDAQFDIFSSFLDFGFDMYAYVTFTSEQINDLQIRMNAFVDRLQKIHPNLPLRTVPLKIEAFSPTKLRMTDTRRRALQNQYDVHREWRCILESRFSERERLLPIDKVSLD